MGLTEWIIDDTCPVLIFSDDPGTAFISRFGYIDLSSVLFFWITGHVFIQQHSNSEETGFLDLLHKSLISFCNFGSRGISSKKKMFLLAMHHNFAIIFSVYWIAVSTIVF